METPNIVGFAGESWEMTTLIDCHTITHFLACLQAACSIAPAGNSKVIGRNAQIN